MSSISWVGLLEALLSKSWPGCAGCLPFPGRTGSHPVGPALSGADRPTPGKANELESAYGNPDAAQSVIEVARIGEELARLNRASLQLEPDSRIDPSGAGGHGPVRSGSGSPGVGLPAGRL